MNIIVATIFVLVLYVNGAPKEFMGHYENTSGQWVEMGMSGCLHMKRTLKRNGWKDSRTGKTRFVCEEHKVQLGENWEGHIVVQKILD